MSSTPIHRDPEYYDLPVGEWACLACAMEILQRARTATFDLAREMNIEAVKGKPLSGGPLVTFFDLRDVRKIAERLHPERASTVTACAVVRATREAAAEGDEGASERWCRDCRGWVLTIEGECGWCGTRTRIRPNARPLDQALRCITPQVLELAYRLYQHGYSIAAVAKRLQDAGLTTYRSQGAAEKSIWSNFTSRGWKLRDQKSASRKAKWKHGRLVRANKGTPDFLAYNRELKRRNGKVRDVKCAAVTKAGRPCPHFALAGREHCMIHEPARQERVRDQLAAMRAKQRASLIRWGDVRGPVDGWLARNPQGRAALARAYGRDRAIIDRLVAKPDDHLCKPHVVARILQAVEQLERQEARDV